MAYAFVGFGLVLLIIGSESVVRGGVGLSRAFGLSPLLIGLLVVSAGTSAPELVVSLQGALHHATAIALGNIVGSNLVNILLILGVGALIRPIPTSPKIVLRDGGVLVASSAALVFLMKSGEITRQDGWMLLAGLIAYIVLCFATDWRRAPLHCVSEARAQARGGRQALTPAMSLILLVFGLVCLFFGGGYVVDGGVAVARLYHVPQAAIGLTLIAFGSSLPELATTITASLRRETGLVIGNLIGSNIFNILLVLGVATSVHPLGTDHLVSDFDLYVMLGTAVVLPLMLVARWRLTRGQGVFLLLTYLVYLGVLAARLGYLPHSLGGTL